ncbi:MAG: hypothetical protein ACI396_01740 [Acutalibacteraceae bacterium]
MKNCKYAIAAALAAMIMLFGASCKDSAEEVRPTTATSSVTETATTEAATTAAQTTTEVTTADATTAATTTVKTTAKATTAKNVSDSDTIKKTSAAVKTTAKKTQAATTKKPQTTTKKQTTTQTLYHYKDGTTGYTPQDGAWYIDPVYGDKCVYVDYSNIDSDYDGVHCPQCGKVEGDGRNGTCCVYICDAVCEYCGEHVKAMECHTCGK